MNLSLRFAAAISLILACSPAAHAINCLSSQPMLSAYFLDSFIVQATVLGYLDEDESTARLHVDRVFRGELEQTEITVESGGGLDCRGEVRRLAIGSSHVIVFGENAAQDGYISEFSSLKLTVTDGTVEGYIHAEPCEFDVTTGEGCPPRPPTQSMSLDQFDALQATYYEGAEAGFALRSFFLPTYTLSTGEFILPLVKVFANQRQQRDRGEPVAEFDWQLRMESGEDGILTFSVVRARSR